MPVMPLSGFRVLDDEFVFVESLAGEQPVSGFLDHSDSAGV
jgi:hypothetical protein